ncbi:MAG: hypothetical protein U0694_13345 [Anaerolineae bacterium]
MEAPAVEAPVEAAAPVVTTGTISGQVLRWRDQHHAGRRYSAVCDDCRCRRWQLSIADVPAGIYTITADARGYLPAQGVVGVLPGNTVVMSTVTLVAGDLNNDNLAVDASDSALLTNTYRMNAATLPPELDLDHNGRIGLGDLRVLAANLGQVGPTLWQ